MPLLLTDYTYTLPQDRIALYPLKERDQSKLLVYKDGQIRHYHFFNLPELLPQNSFLFFNDTRVIPARLLFRKETGAVIEIFLLHPVHPSSVMSEAMLATGSCTWQCTVGNLKRWPDDLILSKNMGTGKLNASLADRKKGWIRFDWTTSASFSEIITQSGETPLPPYLHRRPETSDRDRYQTVYSHYAGAVAAPTAGLHFTETIFEKLRSAGISHDFITLHVSAGTFQPIKSERVDQHTMHSEQFIVTRENIRNLLDESKFVVAVGTTSMRTLESLYWYGVRLLNQPSSEFIISQNDPYERHGSLPPARQTIKAIADYMDSVKAEKLHGTTSIYIMPGYEFKVCKGLVTNFHQPGSTLLLLVAAFIGDDWKKVYNEAMEGGYRFLSYGDSSLLIP